LVNALLMQAHQAVEDVITQYPEGVAIDQIERSLPSAPNRRTLQRWLHVLMAQHQIRREGHVRAVKYWRIKPVDSVMVHLPYLQPFVDVNKRVSRLAANIPMIQRNLCPLSFVDVPQSL
jgi:hypothetical protein